jgi:MinD-like ATPase involved in chromosome partitioning or flagellar assembly
VADRDDALRRELGWTGPEESDFEPDIDPPAPPRPAVPPVPRRPPVDFVAADTAANQDAAAPAEEQAQADGPNRVPPEHNPPAAPPGPRSGPIEGPPAAPFQEPDRAGGNSREQPSRFGPPLPSPGHESRQPPQAGARPDHAQWGPPPDWQPPPRAPRPAAPSGQGQPRPGGPPTQPWPVLYGPEGATAPPPPTESYADRIRVDDLVPPRRVPPARGWRYLVYRATFGLINPGQSPDEIRQAELESKIKGVLRGHYKVGVMGKGGVGKTTVSASVGSVFAELRQDDRVVAIDADTAFGKLGSRVDPKAPGSYWELASDQHLETFADVRSRVGNNAAGLFVLAGEATPARRRVLDPAIYREATYRLDRHFTISIIDCSSTMDAPVTQEVLRDLDALIVVSSPWVDGAAAAGQTMDWLANRGLTSLLQRTVIVLNDSDGHADKRTRSILLQQFSSQGQVVIEVPFDAHLRPGGVIDSTSEISPPTRRRFLEIAAALAEHFPSTDDRARERH